MTNLPALFSNFTHSVASGPFITYHHLPIHPFPNGLFFHPYSMNTNPSRNSPNQTLWDQSIWATIVSTQLFHSHVRHHCDMCECVLSFVTTPCTNTHNQIKPPPHCPRWVRVRVSHSPQIHYCTVHNIHLDYFWCLHAHDHISLFSLYSTPRQQSTLNAWCYHVSSNGSSPKNAI